MIEKAVVIALEEAGVFSFSHDRIATGWFNVTGAELEARDVQAWAGYVAQENASRIRKLSAGFIVFSLTQGFKAPEENYDNADMTEDLRAFIIS